VPGVLRQRGDPSGVRGLGESRVRSAQGALADNGVDLIQVTRAGTAGKDAADIRIAVDAMEALITHPEVAVFIAGLRRQRLLAAGATAAGVR
jgi:hypothetical protein